MPVPCGFFAAAKTAARGAEGLKSIPKTGRVQKTGLGLGAAGEVVLPKKGVEA